MELMNTVKTNNQRIYDAGYDSGKQAEWSAFWDTYQNNGQRVDYAYAFFGDGWTIDTFKPKYNIGGSITLDNAFRGSNIKGDMVEIAESLGISFNLGYVYNITQCFRSSHFTRLGVLKLTHQNITSFNYVFDGMTYLETIDELTIKNNGLVTFTNAFTNCSSLKNITFGGNSVIGRDISFAYSPLTPASMKSVIEHLKNYSGTTDAHKYTVTFNADCWVALEADSNSPDGGTWADYVDSLGWNI